MASTGKSPSRRRPPGLSQESWLTWTPEKDAYGSWWMYAHRPRRGKSCEACPECTNNYDRWCLLVGAVVTTLQRAFRERRNVAGLRILDDTLRYFGLTVDEYCGVGPSPILALHPDWRILALLHRVLAHPPQQRTRRGRPEALDEQWLDWRTFQAVTTWVRQHKTRNASTGWVGLAEVYARVWSHLLQDLRSFRKVRPPLIRETPPSLQAFRAWMVGHDEAMGAMAHRLTVSRLTYRIVTYLRYMPDQSLKGNIAEFVLRNELAMERRIGRARRRARMKRVRFWDVA
jgi:hypothetical protein